MHPKYVVVHADKATNDITRTITLILKDIIRQVNPTSITTTISKEEIIDNRMSVWFSFGLSSDFTLYLL